MALGSVPEKTKRMAHASMINTEGMIPPCVPFLFPYLSKEQCTTFCHPERSEGLGSCMHQDIAAASGNKVPLFDRVGWPILVAPCKNPVSARNFLSCLMRTPVRRLKTTTMPRWI